MLCGAAATTPTREYEEPILTRSTKVRKVEELGPLSEILIRKYNKTSKSGLAKVSVKPLDINIQEPNSMALTLKLDMVWMTSYKIFTSETYPSWGGFNQTVLTDGDFEINNITITPFANDKLDKLDTIYSVLKFGQILAEKYEIPLAFVTYDQSFYIKAVDIILASDDLKNLVP